MVCTASRTTVMVRRSQQGNLQASLEKSPSPIFSQSQTALCRTARSGPAEVWPGPCSPAGTPAASPNTCTSPRQHPILVQQYILTSIYTVSSQFKPVRPTFCIQHFSGLWGCRTAGRMRTGMWCTPVSVCEEKTMWLKIQPWFPSTAQITLTLPKDPNLNSLQVDVLQVAVVEVEIAAVSFLVSELHQVC